MPIFVEDYVDLKREHFSNFTFHHPKEIPYLKEGRKIPKGQSNS